MVKNQTVGESGWNPAEWLNTPAFTPLQALINRLPDNRFPDCADLNALCHEVRFSFVEADDNVDYESYIHQTRQIPTRTNNLHDLFNALIWLTFPQSKTAMNALHVDYSKKNKNLPAGQRGSARDVLTLLDESGVILVSRRESLFELVRQFQWKDLFWQQRDELQKHFRCVVFGHSIYEKAVTPYLGLTAKALMLTADDQFFDRSPAEQIEYLDTAVVDYLNRPGHLTSTRTLQPFPLLGMPGWHADNNHAEFYDNRDYFRPGRLRFLVEESDNDNR